MRNPFREHPASIGETYVEHMVAAVGFGLRLTFGGLACLVHALLPFMFVTTASDTVRSLSERMASRGARVPAPFRPQHGVDQ